MADSTANERIRDALIRHQVNLQRLSAGLSREAVSLLDRTEASIAREIEAAIAKGASIETSRGLRRLQNLEDTISLIRSGATDELTRRLEDSLGDLVRHEAEFTSALLDTESPAVLDTQMPSPALLRTLVSTSPFEGQLLAEWMARLADGDSRRVRDAVRVGMTRGLSTQEIVRLAVGSTDLDGADGATQLTRNQATSLIRTAVNAFSNQARNLTIEENADLVDFEMYHATLDSRTTPICRGLDGKVYRRGEGRFPPQHFGCRSIRVPLLAGEAVGQRPMKGSTERQVAREFGERNGFSALGREDVPRGLKGAFDKFARQRVREMTGQTPAATTYAEFFARQSKDFQEEVLGVTKARLFRQGGLALDKFSTRAGTELTLKQLVARERDAFVRAGLDPARFR